MSTEVFQVTAAIRATIVARPEAFLTAYSGLGGAAYVRSQLGGPFASLLDQGCLATFASVVAFNAASAGMTSLDPRTATLHQLLTEPALTSQHFCRLSALLALLGSPRMVPPDPPTGNPTKATLHFLTWLGTVPLNTGTHTQLVITNVLDQAYLLLDPRYAYAVRIPFGGAVPQSSLSVAENVAHMMQTPSTPDNLAVLDPAATSSVPQMLQTVLSGALGPEYLDDGLSSGSTFWDANFGQVVRDMG